jgi:hypothetical protein
MTEINCSPSVWKNRREALALLLGAAFLGPVACSQRESPPITNSHKKRRMALVIEGSNNAELKDLFKGQHLSKSDLDQLVVVNLLPENDVSILFEKSNPFEEIKEKSGENDPPESAADDRCITFSKLSYKRFKIKKDAPEGQYDFCFKVGSTCPDNCPETTAMSAGDITIDP